MGTLYIDHADSELRWRDGVLELRRQGQCLKTFPGRLLERVVLRADTTLTSGTLAAMADAGVGLVVLGGRSGQKVAHVIGVPGSDVAVRVAQCQKLSDEAYAARWCALLVKAKLRSQRRVLMQALEHRPDLRLALTKGIRQIERALESLREVPNRESIRGIEGAAAAGYFQAYAHLFAAGLGFTKRQRRPAPDPVNACLSLGYTLLHAQAVRACWVVGLDPMVGFLHSPARGRASMACDLMEPWRARVDAWVWQQFRDRIVRAEHFGRDGAGACVMGKAGRSNFYGAFTSLQSQFDRGLQRQARMLANALKQLALLPVDTQGAEDAEAGEHLEES